jgi:hypothetical protein
MDPGTPFGDSVESHHRKADHPFGAIFSGRRRSRDFATATRRPTSHRPARSPASGLARPTFPSRSRRIVVRNVVDRLLQHNHDAWAPPYECVDTSRVFLEVPRTRCLGPFPDCPKLRAVHVLRVTEDCDWPRFTESRLLSHWERQSPHSTNLEHPVVTHSRVRCFGEARRVSKRSRPIRRRRSAKNYRLEIHRRCRRRTVRGPRCFPSCSVSPSATIARRPQRPRLLAFEPLRVHGWRADAFEYPSRLMPFPESTLTDSTAAEGSIDRD